MTGLGGCDSSRTGAFAASLSVVLIFVRDHGGVAAVDVADACFAACRSTVRGSLGSQRSGRRQCSHSPVLFAVTSATNRQDCDV